MLVVAHTLYKIAMNPYAIDADQTLTTIHQPNALGKDPLTGIKTQSTLIIIKALDINLMVIMTQMFNYQLPPVNQTTSLNYWKPQRK